MLTPLQVKYFDNVRFYVTMAISEINSNFYAWLSIIPSTSIMGD
jgi:hypothetical protein